MAARMADRPRILIVEDEVSVLETLQEILEAEYHLSSARTVDEACACLRASHIDVAIIDWQLPDGHGDAVASVAAKHGVPIITMSGYPDAISDLQQSQRAHLMKPFGVKALDEAIYSVLNERSPPKASY